ncbi:PREDICTED: uncharacterized protein LOC108780032 [Cyphomyrmex costatus]|uniref:uncharacterized protein LOC108780032 n=1 Tax=Cyphomyrmex costatus TaxID=456900 RepID=UPI0008523182|nr:PREDICTED: uncharacterized protein LOC108780032 [Cyphomyrmex costatus]
MDGTGTNTRWCSAPGCMLNIKITRRHFFRFPKDRKRWLEWIKACDRMDLVTLGPELSNRYYRLCHLHFRVEMFRNIEGRIYLSKEAVPSIFLKPLQQTGDNNSSTTLFQPISFVTIFLKPENRNKNCIDLSQSEASETHSMKPDEKNVSSAQTVLDMKPENDNRDTSAEIQFIKESDTNVESAPMLSRIFPKDECSNTDIIDLTSTDYPVPTTSKTVSVCTTPSKTVSICTTSSKMVSICTTSSKTVSVHTTQQNGDKTSKRKHWNISTQTPESWISLVRGKRPMEKSDADGLVIKRKKTFDAENEDSCLNMDQFKTACVDLLPREGIDPILSSVHVIRARAHVVHADSGGGLPRTPRTYEEGRVAGDISGTVVSSVTASTGPCTSTSASRRPTRVHFEDVNAVEDSSRSVERREMCVRRFFPFFCEHALKEGSNAL